MRKIELRVEEAIEFRQYSIRNCTFSKHEENQRVEEAIEFRNLDQEIHYHICSLIGFQLLIC